MLQFDISSWTYVAFASLMMDWMFRLLVVLQLAGPSNSQSDSSGASVVRGVDPDAYGQGL